MLRVLCLKRIFLEHKTADSCYQTLVLGRYLQWFLPEEAS